MPELQVSAQGASTVQGAAGIHCCVVALLLQDFLYYMLSKEVSLGILDAGRTGLISYPAQPQVGKDRDVSVLGDGKKAAAAAEHGKC